MTLKLQLNRLKSLALINKRGLAFLCMMPAIVLASLFLAPLVSSLEVISPTVTQSLLNHPDQTDIDIPVQIQVSVPFQLDQSSQQFSIFAFTNQPPEAITSIAFYVRTTDATETLPVQLYLLGIDQNGQDGWSISVDAEKLSFLDPCRIMAMASLSDSQVMWAESTSFYSPQAALLVTPALNTADPASVPLAVLPLADDDSAALLAVSQETVPPTVSSSPLRRLIGVVGDGISGLWTKGFWDSIDLTNVLANGIYDVSILGSNSGKSSIGTTTSQSLVVQQNMAPSVSIIEPAPLSAVSSPFDIVLIAQDADSAIERIDVYIYQDVTLCPGIESEQPYPGNMMWLGTDSSSVDGWRIQARLPEDWQGDGWYIFAIAWDSSGLAGWSSTEEPVTILLEGQARAVVVSPLEGQTVSGSSRVQVAVPDNPQNVSGLELYARNESGLGICVGNMNQVGNLWQVQWDTTDLPDGEYGLYVVGEMLDGSNTLSPVQLVSVVNNAPRLNLLSLPSEAPVAGQIAIKAQLVAGTCSVIGVQMVDELGNVITLPDMAISEDIASSVFSTEGLLAGKYVLSLMAEDDLTGQTTIIQRDIQLVSEQRALTLTVDDDETLKGIVAVNWTIEGVAVENGVTIQYSPDAGDHWTVLASGELEAPYQWDTRDNADSTEGVLRVIAVTPQSILSAERPVVVNNVNDAPVIYCSSPVPDYIISSQCLITWQAYDTDDDTLSAQVEYRVAGGEWQIIAKQTENQGQLTWLVRNVTPGTYQVRIKVFDPDGAVGEDSVYPVYISGNSAPVIRLNAPLENIELEDEAIVLWNTYDEDGDDLTISIEYSYDAGKTWLPLAEDLDNTGYYLWKFSFLPAGDEYRLRVIANDGQATGSAETGGLLTIGTPTDAAYELVSPREGDQLEGSVLLCWRALDESEQATPVSLMVREANSNDWQLITEDCSQSNFGIWDATGLTGDYQLVLGIFGRTSGRYQLLDVVDEVSVTVDTIVTEPSVILLSPSAGQSVNGDVVVSWALSGFSTQATAQIDLWTEAQPNWVQVGSTDAQSERYILNEARFGIATSAMVRVTIVDDATCVSSAMEGAFCVLGNSHPPLLEVGSPDSDDVLADGQLVWMASDSDDDDVSVSIELSSDNGVSWDVLAARLDASGTYDLSSLPLGSKSRIRISATDGLFSTSWMSGEINLSSRPFVYIEAPLAGDRWSGLEIVRWQPSNGEIDPLEIDIQISMDGQNWESIATRISDEGVFLFDTRDMMNGWYWLRLVAVNETSRSEISGPFEVNNATFNQPLASLIVATEGFPMSGLERIAWDVIDEDNDSISIALAYSLDEGATWTTFATDDQAEGSVLWDTRDLPNTDRLWLRITATDGRYAVNDYLGPVEILNEGNPDIFFLTPSEPVWTGVQRVSWTGVSSVDCDATVQLDVSYDGGQTWRVRATDKALTDSYLWDTQSVKTGTSVRFRIAVIESGNVIAYAHSDEITIWGNTTLEPLE